MKCKKTWIACALMALLLCCLLPNKAQAATYGSLTYTVSNGEVTITACSTSVSGDYVIPDTINGYPVTAIGEKAFYQCTRLTGITIPDSVTSIGSGAFSGCSSLQDLTIPFAGATPKTPADTKQYPLGYIFGTESFTGAERIAQYTRTGTSYFSGSYYYIPTSLQSVTITGGEIYGCTFMNCVNLTSVALMDGVTGIGRRTFEGCTGLTTIVLPEGVTEIGVDTFSGCSNLTDVALPSTVNIIGARAFEGCSNLKSITIPQSVTAIGMSAFEECTSLASITISEGVTQIGEYAFEGCSNLTNIALPEGVTEIGYHAFKDCSSLTNIAIPDSVDVIGQDAFQGTGISYNTYGNAQYLGSINNPYHALIKATATSITDFSFHRNTKVIGDFAFSDCTQLTKIDLPADLTRIGNGVFYNCEKMIQITIPQSVTIIGSTAFAGCSSLVNITIPEGVTEIGISAFADCRSLAGITIPEGVTKIESSAFANCISLTGITMSKDVTEIGSFAFDNCRSLTGITIPVGVTRIEGYAFYGCAALTNVKLPVAIKEIGVFAFADCTALNSITIPASVTSIADGAFYGCSRLASVIYCGTLSQWNQIYFCDDNDYLINASRSYHSYAAANCTAPKICTICGMTEGVALGHNWTAADCTTAKTCTTCGVVEGEPLGHSGDLWFDLVAPTCTATGIKARICDACGETETASIDALGHSYTSVSTAPTCTEQGYTTNTCAVCGDVTVSDYVAANGHSYEAVVTEPTCTKQGYTTRTCTVCGDVTVTDYVDATGHSFGDWTQTKAPNCTETGEESRSCFCGETEVQTVAALGHSYDAVVTAPTCTEQGYTTNTCSVCGDENVTDNVDAKGHGWSAWIQTAAPSCTAEGAQVRFCNCGVRETQALERLIHTVGTDGCTLCGAFNTYHWVLSADATVEASLTQDLYVDLNGYKLSGTIALNGYKIYGMDSTTDGYSCENMGYFSCVDENGNVIVPESHFKGSTETIGSVKRYMTISTESGYTFHRFYLGVTHASIKPSVGGVGYKAVFAGDEMVRSVIDSYGYSLQLTGFAPVTAEKSGSPASGKAFTVRINGFDVDTYGETALTAQVYITVNGETVSASAYTTTVKDMVCAMDANAAAYTQTQITALKDWLSEYIAPKSWNLTNI